MAPEPSSDTIKIEKQESRRGKKIKIELNELTLWRFGTITFCILFIVSILTSGFGGRGSDVVVPSGTAQQLQPLAAPSPVVNVKTPEDSVFKGEKNAPITIVEFSDFQCPFCGRFYTETLPQLEQEYIKTGKVKLVYRHLPLSFHPQAHTAAQASECANDQGKFWEYHDLIFKNQQRLGEEPWNELAQQLNLDVSAFKTCLESGKYKQKVDRDNTEAAQYGASGTPTFFINGQKLIGAQPFGAFKAVIDVELTT